MSKIILINPGFNIPKENYDSSVSVGLLSIATFLDSKGVDVRLIDFARQTKAQEIFEKELMDAQFVGFSVMTTQIANALRISRLVREKNKKAKIIWGGSHPTFFIKPTAEHELIDIVSFGEGEHTLLELSQGKELKNILGIAYKDNGEVVVNDPRPLHDPAEMPLFNWDLVDDEVLKNIHLVPSLTSRGCPHRCTFCINAILKNRWRPRTSEQMLTDLAVIKNYKYFKDKSLRFWDENFFVNKKRAEEIIDGMIEKDLVIPWETTVRADYFRDNMINDEFLVKIKKSGCYLLSFGAESGSPHILAKIKKDITPEQIINSAKMCLKHGIIPQYSFMIGLPGESKKDMMMTIDVIDKLFKLDNKIQILGPQAFRPYPGSNLYNECIESGWKEPESLEAWAEVMENELSYLTVKNFPWVSDKLFVESMEAYVRFGAHSFKSSIGSTVSANKILKLGFVAICKLRWKLKFFKFPIEFILAKNYITKH